MIKLIKDFIKWRKEMKARESIKNGDNTYLINAFHDISVIEKAVKACNADPFLEITFKTLDGITLNIKTNTDTGNKRGGINWEL